MSFVLRFVLSYIKLVRFRGTIRLKFFNVAIALASLETPWISYELSRLVQITVCLITKSNHLISSGDALPAYHQRFLHRLPVAAWSLANLPCEGRERSKHDPKGKRQNENHQTSACNWETKELLKFLRIGAHFGSKGLKTEEHPTNPERTYNRLDQRHRCRSNSNWKSQCNSLPRLLPTPYQSFSPLPLLQQL